MKPKSPKQLITQLNELFGFLLALGFACWKHAEYRLRRQHIAAEGLSVLLTTERERLCTASGRADPSARREAVNIQNLDNSFRVIYSA